MFLLQIRIQKLKFQEQKYSIAGYKRNNWTSTISVDSTKRKKTCWIRIGSCYADGEIFIVEHIQGPEGICVNLDCHFRKLRIKNLPTNLPWCFFKILFQLEKQCENIPHSNNDSKHTWGSARSRFLLTALTQGSPLVQNMIKSSSMQYHLTKLLMRDINLTPSPKYYKKIGLCLVGIYFHSRYIAFVYLKSLRLFILSISTQDSMT